MENTKLYKILSSFDRTRLNRFEKFLHSPYFNVNKDLIQLFSSLDQYFRDSTQTPSKDVIWKQIYAQPYHDLKFRRLCTKLLRLVEKFLGVEYYQENPLTELINQFRVIHRDKHRELFESLKNRIDTMFNRSVDQSSEYFLYKYFYELALLEEEALNYLGKVNLQETIYNLDIFYILEKVKQQIEIIDRKTFVDHQYTNNRIEELIEMGGKEPYSQYPLLNINLSLVNLKQREIDIEKYYSFKNVLLQNIDQISIDEQKFYIYRIINYCISAANKTKSIFDQESLSWFKLALQKELLYVNNELPIQAFRNIVAIASAIDEIEWAEEFIERYGIKLNKSIRENTITFVKAQLEFQKKNFQEVLVLLNNVEFANITYALNAKSLILCSYFELDEYMAFDSFAHSFTTYLTRKKGLLTKEKRKGYQSLISFAKALYNAKLRQNSNPSLHQKIKKSTSAAGYSWLLDKSRIILKEA